MIEIIAECLLEGTTPLQFGKYAGNATKPFEEWEQTHWQDRAHYDSDGNVIIPPEMFSNSIKGAAGYMSKKVPGERNKTFKKKFDAAIMVVDPLVLPMKKDGLRPNWLYVPADGKVGGSTRVYRCFPVVDKWQGTVRYNIFDEVITRDVFIEHLKTSGMFIGIGMFRPERRGWFGRFSVKNVNWLVKK